jgi:hypothetical protein
MSGFRWTLPFWDKFSETVYVETVMLQSQTHRRPGALYEKERERERERERQREGGDSPAAHGCRNARLMPRRKIWNSFTPLQTLNKQKKLLWRRCLSRKKYTTRGNHPHVLFDNMRPSFSIRQIILCVASKILITKRLQYSGRQYYYTCLEYIPQ